METTEFTVAQAKKICMEKWGHLPRCGYEMILVDEERMVERAFDNQGRQIVEGRQYFGYHIHQVKRHVKIFLTNESGSFRVWEWQAP